MATPAWLTRLKPAKFRDVPFHVDVADGERGRVTVTHRYPFSKTGRVYVEDLGAAPRTHTFEAFLVGPNYMDGRDALFAALETPGPGTLVHPYLGELTVALTEIAKHEEKRDAGGYIAFTLSFTETDPQPVAPTAAAEQPELTVNGRAFNYAVTGLGHVTASGTIATKVKGRSLPSFAFESSRHLIATATTALQTKLAPLMRTTAALAQMKRETDAIVLDATTLVRSPFLAVGRLASMALSFRSLPGARLLTATGLLTDLGLTSSQVDTLLRTVGPSGRTLVNEPATVPLSSPVAAITAWAGAFDAADAITRPTGSTPTRLAEQGNFDVWRACWQGLCAVQMSIAAADAVSVSRQRGVGGFTTQEDALRARATVLDRLDALAERVDDTVYNALMDARAAVAAALPGDPFALPHLITYTPPVTVPSLVLAHRLYGGIALETDLLDRNRVRHPGFVPGGIALEVLSRG